MEFLSLTSLDEALEKLESFGADAALVAGGTAIRYQLASGQIKAKAVLHIERLGEAQGISCNSVTRLGALTNLRDIAENAKILKHFPSVAQAAGKCGGWQTQSVATVGGNVCGAAPNADLVPPLLVQDAEVELTSRARGSHSLALGDFPAAGPLLKQLRARNAALADEGLLTLAQAWLDTGQVFEAQLVLARLTSGMIDASATRSPAMPRTRPN